MDSAALEILSSVLPLVSLNPRASSVSKGHQPGRSQSGRHLGSVPEPASAGLHQPAEHVSASLPLSAVSSRWWLGSAVVGLYAAGAGARRTQLLAVSQEQGPPLGGGTCLSRLHAQELPTGLPSVSSSSGPRGFQHPHLMGSQAASFCLPPLLDLESLREGGARVLPGAACPEPSTQEVLGKYLMNN